MKIIEDKPYVIYMAETIYNNIVDIAWQCTLYGMT